MTQQVLLKEKAYAELKMLLLDGYYEPGAFLSERQLVDSLGMSKTPIRAALERLEMEHFVTISPRQGIVVRELSFQEIKDHYEIRSALESFVVTKLAGTLTKAQVEILQAILDRQQDHAAGHHVQDYMRTDADFHLTLCEFAGNQEIIRVMTHQREKLYRVVMTLLERDSRHIVRSYSEHNTIFEALQHDDGAQAAMLMKAHFDSGKQMLFNT